MSSGMKRWMLVLAAAMMGSGDEGSMAAAGQAAAYKAGERGVLRVKTDGARGRLWVLGVDDVRVYDIAGKRLIRRIVLPNWSVARFVCGPDMVLDGSGSAMVSSNAQSKLWRIDADTFEVRERDIRLNDREQWDVGFGALMLAADGNILALTSTGGWLWKIDVAGGTARMWNRGAPILNVCDLMPIEHPTSTDTENRCGPEEARLC
jgi:hypothetical protein